MLGLLFASILHNRGWLLRTKGAFFKCLYDGYELDTEKVRPEASFSRTPCNYTMYGNVSAEHQPMFSLKDCFSLFWRIPLRSLEKEERRYAGEGWH